MEEKRFAAAVFDTTVFDSEDESSFMPAVQLAAVAPGGPFVTAPESFRNKLWRGKWILLWTSVAFALIALMVGALQPPLYKVQSSIEIRSPDRPAKADAGEAGPLFESYLQTQIRLIQSRPLLERVLAKLPDAERARLMESPHFWWSRISYEQSVESIRHHISAHPSEQAGIVDISFLSPDAKAGAHCLNLLTQELADLNVERTWLALQHNRQWAERQIDDLRKKWEQSEQALTEYSQASGLSISRAGAVAAPALLRPQSASGGGVQEANDSKLRQLRNKLVDLNRQISQWQALYGSAESPTSQQLKSEAIKTETAIRQRQAALRQTASAAPSNYAVISAAPEEPTSAEQPAQARAHLKALQQEAESNRVAYEKTATRLKEASFSGAAQLSDISVVDPAIPLAASTTPSQLLTGSLGAFTGLLLAGMFIGVRGRLSNTFSEPALLAESLRLHVLGSIPVDRFSQQENVYDAVTQQPALQINFENNQQTAEAFRSIRSSILLGSQQRSGPRKLVFTSAQASEGKTFVVVNLGAALASAQRRVLLVDGNLRNPALHKIFGADNDHGLADLLSRQISERPITSRDVIRETQIPDLYILSAGQAGIKAPEVLSSAQLPQLIREFAKGFDFVLLDSPPILPYADARSLARSADAVVLVVKAGATSRQSAMQARDAISQDGAAIFGTILTEWDGGASSQTA